MHTDFVSLTVQWRYRSISVAIGASCIRPHIYNQYNYIHNDVNMRYMCEAQLLMSVQHYNLDLSRSAISIIFCTIKINYRALHSIYHELCVKLPTPLPQSYPLPNLMFTRVDRNKIIILFQTPIVVKSCYVVPIVT